MKLPKVQSRFITGLLLVVAGCSSDKSTGKGGATEGGTCSTTLSPGNDDAKTIQDALDSVKQGDTVCLAAGTYKVNRSLNLTGATNITFRGTGATRDAVLLDFTTQASADGGGSSSAQGMLITTDHFLIENLSIKNTAGNGVKFQANGVIFRNIKVGWDQTKTSNGAYAIYPTGAQNVLIDNCEAYNAADAGVYAGQCTNVLFTNNNVHDNVLGIEIENTTNAEAHDNDVHGNTCGFLLDLLPGLQKKTSNFYSVHDNHVHDNNLANFARKNTTAALMQQGTGMMVLAASDIEITRNNFENNGGVATTIISYDTVDVAATTLGSTPDAVDPGTNRWPERIYIHGNTYTNNGNDPKAIIYALAATAAGDAGGGKIPYYAIWDGVLTHTTDGGPNVTSVDGQKICLGTPEQSEFLNFNGLNNIGTPSAWSTSTTGHTCTQPAIPAVNPTP